jgi:ABC-type sugar transport system permease subunit
MGWDKFLAHLLNLVRREIKVRVKNGSSKYLFQVLGIIILVLFDIVAVEFAYIMGTKVGLILGLIIGLFILLFNVVFLINRLYPWRWIIPALAGMFLLVLYPMGYSLNISFTNYGDEHLLSKDQVIAGFQDEYYAPPNSILYRVTVFSRNKTDPVMSDFRFWLVDPDGNAFVGSPDEAKLTPMPASDTSYGPRDAKGIPEALGEFARVAPQTFSQRLQGLTLDDPPDKIRLTKLLLLDQVFEAQRMQHRYSYDAATNQLTDRQTGKVYREEAGFFVTGSGTTLEQLTPGFTSNVGLKNITRVITDPSIRGQFWQIFAWTVAFALLTVVTQTALGLGFALILNSADLPLRAVWRSILIIPYAIPFWITAQTWRGLLNPLYGPVNLFIKNVIGVSPLWFSDPWLAKIAILFINMYLGFSYMMLVSLGALQSIPAELYEAAIMDGANDVKQFRHITLPLLLVAIGPLLIASFAFNFNNFTIIELVNNGGPPFSAASVAGQTDILLSYTYRLAFGGRGAQYGFAAAICIFIFLIVATLTIINFRFTRTLEEISENA